ncbi:MAG: spondin domain-containing protein [Pirellulales bacterium]
MQMRWFNILGCAVVAVACSMTAQGRASTVTYSVKFAATWSAATHPNAYPVGAHFSPLIGGVHSDQVSFWSPGSLASAGIEQMAEVGGTANLRSEVQAAMAAGKASAVIQGSGIDSPGSTTVSIDVSSEFPLVTLVSMVAPSPDWFVGVHELDLRDGDGWKNQVIVDLFPYDAGTENGVGFSLSNPDTVPRQPVGRLGFPFGVDDPRLGTFTFTRTSVPEPSAGVLMTAAAALCGLRLRRRSELPGPSRFRSPQELR